MTELFETIKNAISDLSMDQIAALMVGICAFGVAKSVVKEGISFIMSVVGVLFILYFAAPDLYYKVFEIIKDCLAAVGL